MLNKERNEKAINPLRGTWHQLRNRFTRPGKPVTDEYRVEFEKKTAELNQLAADYEAKIYAANQPVARQYQIVPSSN